MNEGISPSWERIRIASSPSIEERVCNRGIPTFSRHRLQEHGEVWIIVNDQGVTSGMVRFGHEARAFFRTQGQRGAIHFG